MCNCPKKDKIDKATFFDIRTITQGPQAKKLTAVIQKGSKVNEIDE